MQAAGLNIFPNEDSTKYVDVQLKVRIQDIATSLS